MDIIDEYPTIRVFTIGEDGRIKFREWTVNANHREFTPDSPIDTKIQHLLFVIGESGAAMRSWQEDLLWYDFTRVYTPQSNYGFEPENSIYRIFEMSEYGTSLNQWVTTSIIMRVITPLAIRWHDLIFGEVDINSRYSFIYPDGMSTDKTYAQFSTRVCTPEGLMTDMPAVGYKLATINSDGHDNPISIRRVSLVIFRTLY